jgi:hypothetical protein
VRGADANKVTSHLGRAIQSVTRKLLWKIGDKAMAEKLLAAGAVTPPRNER